jgi:hypothetical protein
MDIYVLIDHPAIRTYVEAKIHGAKIRQSIRRPARDAVRSFLLSQVMGPVPTDLLSKKVSKVLVHLVHHLKNLLQKTEAIQGSLIQGSLIQATNNQPIVSFGHAMPRTRGPAYTETESSRQLSAYLSK